MIMIFIINIFYVDCIQWVNHQQDKLSKLNFLLWFLAIVGDHNSLISMEKKSILRFN